VSPAKGAHFAMFLAHMKPGGAAAPPSALTERFVFVVSGAIELRHENETGVVEAAHGADGWAYMPMGWEGSLTSKRGAHLVVYERIFAKAEVRDCCCCVADMM
jgi:(S)-ureidoglycine aminohydrolase